MLKSLFMLMAAVGVVQKIAPEAQKHFFVFVVSAEQYKNLTDELRTAYVSGWLDGRLNAGMVGTPKTIKAMRDCIEGKTIQQATAIVDKYIAGHPEHGTDRRRAKQTKHSDPCVPHWNSNLSGQLGYSIATDRYRITPGSYIARLVGARMSVWTLLGSRLSFSYRNVEYHLQTTTINLAFCSVQCCYCSHMFIG